MNLGFNGVGDQFANGNGWGNGNNGFPGNNWW